MSPTRRAVLGATTGTFALAGCLGGDTGDGGGTPTDDGGTDGDGGTPIDGGMGGGTVRVRSHPELGDVLVGPEGLTLYMFDQDTQGEDASTCAGGCAESWPPLTVADPSAVSAGDGVTATLTTFERMDGSVQVAANGWPLYYYAPDQDPGDATGQGVGGVWWVLTPAGVPVRGGSDASTSTDAGMATPAPTETDDGGGYNY